MDLRHILDQIFKETAKRERYSKRLAKANALIAEAIVTAMHREFDFNDTYGIRYAFKIPDPSYAYLVKFLDPKNHTNNFITFLPSPDEHRALINFLDKIGRVFYVASRDDHIELANNWKTIVDNAGSLLKAENTKLAALGRSFARHFEHNIDLLRKITIDVTAVSSFAEILEAKRRIWEQIDQIRLIQRGTHPVFDCDDFTPEAAERLSKLKDKLYNQVICPLENPNEMCVCAFYNTEAGSCGAPPAEIEKLYHAGGAKNT